MSLLVIGRQLFLVDNLKKVSPAIKHVIPNTAHLISKLLSKHIKVGWNLAWMNLYFCIVKDIQTLRQKMRSCNFSKTT